jgi:hypothetical protein
VIATKLLADAASIPLEKISRLQVLSSPEAVTDGVARMVGRGSALLLLDARPPALPAGVTFVDTSRLSADLALRAALRGDVDALGLRIADEHSAELALQAALCGIHVFVLDD